MKKILMVCLGNICRSPMAEGIIRDEFRKKGIEVQVDSAGTAAYHVGEGADIRAQAELRKYDIDISEERAQKFIPQFFDEYDMIFAMDQANYADILAQTRTDDDRNKVDMLMNLVEKGKNISIPDPYYGGDEGFTRVYKMIKLAGKKLVVLEH